MAPALGPAGSDFLSRVLVYIPENRLSAEQVRARRHPSAEPYQRPCPSPAPPLHRALSSPCPSPAPPLRQALLRRPFA